MTELQIQKMMKSLDLTREEAIELIKEDETVDKMSTKEVQSDLTKEQKAIIKDATRTKEHSKTVYKFDKKERTVKVSDEKTEIFNEICEFLTKNGTDFRIEKQNKLIIIKKNDKIFKLDLIEQRKSKKN